MIKIVGVRFRNAGKVYYFDPKHYKIKMGDHVIVETARGVEYGTVSGNLREVPESKVVQPLKSVLRVATAEDDERARRNREKEREAMRVCREKIRKHELDMKLIDAEYTFDNNKILFYFTADGRIDFRDLVKDLAAVFRTRIELRQIGVRDETKILGGIGSCGRPLCCHTFLSEFAPVSIKMAKEQNLSLNPTKISGVCGRLMCCLKNEEETYEYLNSKLPGLGDTVYTHTGLKGEVSSVNVLRQKVKVLVDVDDEKELQEYDVEDLQFKPRKKKEKNHPGDKEGKQGKKNSGEKEEKRRKDASGEREERRGEDASGEREGRRGKDASAEREERRGEDASGEREGRHGKDASAERRGRHRRNTSGERNYAEGAEEFRKDRFEEKKLRSEKDGFEDREEQAGKEYFGEQQENVERDAHDEREGKSGRRGSRHRRGRRGKRPSAEGENQSFAGQTSEGTGQ